MSNDMNAANEMYEMDLIESQDARLRHSEGGGSIPHEWQQKYNAITTPPYPYAMSGMGQFGPQGDAGPWYKSPAFLLITGLSLAAMAYVIWDATKGSGSSDSDFTPVVGGSDLL